MATERTQGRSPEKPSVEYPLDCGKIREMLFEYMSHELGNPQSLLVREHLRHCEACSGAAQKIQRTIDLMRRHDPGESVPSVISPKRRRRLIWMMEHPLVANCLKHYKVTSLVVAVIVLIVTFLYLLTVRYPDFMQRELPRFPVRLKIVDPQSTLPPLQQPDPPPLDEPPQLPDLVP